MRKEIIIMTVLLILTFFGLKVFAEGVSFRRVEMQGDLLIYRKGEWVEFYCGGKTQKEIYETLNKTKITNIVI